MRAAEPARVAPRSRVRGRHRQGPEQSEAGRGHRERHHHQTACGLARLLDSNGIPCGPINDYAQVFADPQIARGRCRWRSAPDARQDAHARLADQDVGDAAAGRAPGAAPRRARRRGLREAGRTDEEITDEELRKRETEERVLRSYVPKFLNLSSSGCRAPPVLRRPPPVRHV